MANKKTNYVNHRTDFDIPISKVRIIINEYIINATNKEVAEMRYLEQKSFKEIASLLYISKTSAKRIAYKCYDIIEAHKDEFE